MTLPIQEADDTEQYVPPEPKVWVSLGSEVEIENERLVVNRPLVSDGEADAHHTAMMLK